MAIKAVLSDLGGVLMDFSFDLAVAAWARAAKADERVVAGKLVVDHVWEEFEVGRLPEEEFFRFLGQQCGLGLTHDQLTDGWNAVFIGINAEVERILRDVAAQCIRVVAVTNTNVTHQRVWQSRFETSLTVFDAVYSSCEVGARKPEPAYFEHVLAAEHVEPNEALFIDDLPVNVEGADRLGINAVLYSGVDQVRAVFEDRGLLVPHRVGDV